MRIEKVQLCEYVTAMVRDSSYLFFISYKGATVAQLGDLRNQLSSGGDQCHVLKNTMIHRALANNDVVTKSKLSGDTAMVFGEGDPCPTAKIIRDFNKENRFIDFKGAVVEGDFLGSSDAAALADLPSKEVLQSQILSILQAPMVNLVNVLNAQLTTIPNILQSLITKHEDTSA